MTRAYLAGKMTGMPDFNRAAFVEAAAHLRALGFEVHSPVESDVEVYGSWEAAIARPWKEHLARDLAAVPTCDAIALMAGWEESTGASLELHVARVFGLDVVSAEDGMPMVLTDFGHSYPTEPPSQAATEASRRKSLYERIYLDEDMHDAFVAGKKAADPTETWRNDPYDGDRFVPYAENPERHVYSSGAIKDNKSKSRIDLIPWLPLRLIGDVLAYGAVKYKPNNWRYGLPWGDTFASMQRHLWAWKDGEDLDPETGKPHLAHAGCQLMFLIEYEATGTGTDDRWKGPETDLGEKIMAWARDQAGS